VILFVIPRILFKFVFILVHRWWTIVENDSWCSKYFEWYSFKLLPRKWKRKGCFLGRKNGKHGFFVGGSQRIYLQQFPFKAGLSIGNSCSLCFLIVINNLPSPSWYKDLDEEGSLFADGSANSCSSNQTSEDIEDNEVIYYKQWHDLIIYVCWFFRLHFFEEEFKCWRLKTGPFTEKLTIWKRRLQNTIKWMLRDQEQVIYW